MSYIVANYFNQLPSKSLNKYGERKNILGKGAFGTVYKYETPERTYAVKKMSSYGADVPASTIREVGILTQLKHPAIVDIVDVNMDDKQVNMVMELASNDLNNYLMKTKDLTPDQIKRIFYQLVKGVEYMHSLGTWHRDIKPQNILVFPDGKIKITDFGIGRFGAIPNNLYTVPVFTLWWRSPEILLGSKHYGPEVDVWATGLILGEMGIGGRVINGSNEQKTLEQIVTKIGGMTEAQWPGISGMSEFNSIRKINEEHPSGSLFSNDKLIKKLGPDGIELLKKMLTSNPSKRISIKELSDHPYFDSVRAEFNYPIIPNMVCGDQRVQRDIPAPNFTYKGDINNNMIEILSQWLLDVKSEYNLTPATVFRGRSLVDQYLKATDSKIPRSKLQLLGITAFMISSKIEEIYPASINDYAYIADHTYTTTQIKDMEKDILKVLRFQLAYPILSEYINYYGEGLPKSVRDDATLLGEANMVSAKISNKYQAHDIASALLYIANQGQISQCVTNPDPTLVELIVSEAKRLQEIFKKTGLMGTGKRNEKLGEILDKWEERGSEKEPRSEISDSYDILPPKTIYDESPKISGTQITKPVHIKFDGATDENIDRIDVTNFLTDYILYQAMGYVNDIHSPLKPDIKKKVAEYFSFVLSASREGFYVRGKDNLQRITYTLGKLTVDTNATIQFNYVLPELVPYITIFTNNNLVNGTRYGNSTLSGTLHDL